MNSTIVNILKRCFLDSLISLKSCLLNKNGMPYSLI